MRAFRRVLWIMLMVLTSIVGNDLRSVAFAQTKGQSAPSTAVAPVTESEMNTTYIFAGLGGFIPTSESYRLNFANSFVGLPIEISGGFLFPVGRDVFVPFTVRYDRRTANFITGMSMEVTSIEPGVRYFFERESLHDLRLFGGAEMLLADASVAASYYVSSGPSSAMVGTVTGTALAQRDYFNIGVGLDLGLMYPLAPTTALEAIIHLATFLASPVANGGLGNIGGFSISADYRFGF